MFYIYIYYFLFLLLAMFIIMLLNVYQIESIFKMSTQNESETICAKTPPKKKTKYLCVYVRKWENNINC
jgi:hypothetical protein